MVGVLGTVAASVITGWSTRQHGEAQARAEHAQWRRQVRRDAYGAFLAAASESRNALKTAHHAFVGEGEPDMGAIDRRLQHARDQLNVAQAAWATLAVEGPETVEQAARSIYTTLRSMETTLQPGPICVTGLRDHHRCLRLVDAAPGKVEAEFPTGVRGELPAVALGVVDPAQAEAEAGRGHVVDAVSSVGPL